MSTRCRLSTHVDNWDTVDLSTSSTQCRPVVAILTNVAMGRLQRAEVWQAGMLQVAKLLIVIIEAEGGLGFAAAVAELGGADASSVDHSMAE